MKNGPEISWRLILATYLTALVPLTFPLAKVVADGALSLVAILFCVEILTYQRGRLNEKAFTFFIALSIFLILSAAVCGPFNPKILLSAAGYSRFFLFFGALVCWIGPVSACRRCVAYGLGAALLLVTFDGLYQHFFDVSLWGRPRFERRLTSFFKRPQLGFFISTLVWPVALFYVRECAVYQKKCLASMALSICVVFLTGDRAASALMALSVLWLAGMSAFYYPRYRWKILLLCFGVALVGFLFALTQTLLIGRFRVLLYELSEFSATSYGQLFKSAFYMWLDHPILGIGYKGFAAENALLYAQGSVTYAGIHAHNYYLSWLAQLGLIGCAFWISMIMAMVKRVIQGDFFFQAFGGAALLTIFWPLTTTMDFFSNGTAIVTWLSLGFLFAQTPIKTKLNAQTA